VQGSSTSKINIFRRIKLFSTIYLLQEQKLNYRNYSEQEIILKIFALTSDYDMNMHARIQNIFK
jgi:hypothetical protein